MKINSAFLWATSVVLIIASLSNCTTLPHQSKRKANEVDTLSVYHIPSFITAIEIGNRQVYSQSLSDSALAQRAILTKLVMPSNIVTSDLVFDTEAEKRAISQQLFEIVPAVESNGGIRVVAIPETVLELLKRKNIKYTLVTFGAGFVRKEGNYGDQIAKGIGIGILTLGMVVPIPYKANSTIVCYIIDTERNEIAFYRKDREENDPLNSEIILRQLQTIIHGYYFSK